MKLERVKLQACHSDCLWSWGRSLLSPLFPMFVHTIFGHIYIGTKEDETIQATCSSHVEDYPIKLMNRLMMNRLWDSEPGRKEWHWKCSSEFTVSSDWPGRIHTEFRQKFRTMMTLTCHLVRHKKAMAIQASGHEISAHILCERMLGNFRRRMEIGKIRNPTL